ncbi:MAG: lysophospholipid acyltransferase family protein [Nitrospirota bacterium]
MKARSSRVRKRFNRVSLIFLTRMFKLVAAILPYRFSVAAGGILGFLVYYALPRDRNRAIEHLTKAFPEHDPQWVRATAHRTFIHLGKCLMEEMAINPRRLRRVVSFQGRERLHEAIGQGKGVVYVTGHIGNWEIMGAAVAAEHSLSVVAAPIEPEPVNDMIVGLRASMDVRTILRSRPGAAKELIRVFRENRILGILIDQDTDVEGAFVDFMGIPAWTPTAAAQMAIKFGAPVVFGYIQRQDNGHHVITVEGPLELRRTGNDDEDIRTNTAMFTSRIEEVIRRNPEQWVWMHRRWRRQP